MHDIYSKFSRDLASLGYLIGNFSYARGEINNHIRSNAKLINERNLQLFLEKQWKSSGISALILDCLTDLIDAEEVEIINNKVRRNCLAQRVGYANYFELFCQTRNTKPIITKDINHLTSSPIYHEVIARISETRRTTHTLKYITNSINSSNVKQLEYFFEKKTKKICSRLEKLGVKISHNVEDRYISAASPNTKDVRINKTNRRTFEEVRAMLHAMGHALWMVAKIEHTEEVFGRDNTESETAALIVENYLWTDEEVRMCLGIPIELAEWQNFLTHYYLRMYLARARAEEQFYADESLDLVGVSNIYTANYQALTLFKDDNVKLVLDEKPVSIEFINAISLTIDPINQIESSLVKSATAIARDILLSD